MTATGIDSLASGSDTAERTRIAAPPVPSGAAPDIEPDTQSDQEGAVRQRVAASGPTSSQQSRPTELGADPIASPEQPPKPLIKRAEFWTALVAWVGGRVEGARRWGRPRAGWGAVTDMTFKAEAGPSPAI